LIPFVEIKDFTLTNLLLRLHAINSQEGMSAKFLSKQHVDRSQNISLKMAKNNLTSNSVVSSRGASKNTDDDNLFFLFTDNLNLEKSLVLIKYPNFAPCCVLSHF